MTEALKGVWVISSSLFQLHKRTERTLYPVSRGSHFSCRNAPEFIAWEGGKSCHFFDDAPKK